MLVNNFKILNNCSNQINSINGDYLTPSKTSSLASDTVNLSKKNKKEVRFGSQFLFPAKIKKFDPKTGSFHSIKAAITLLDPYDETDRMAMREIKYKWRNTRFGLSIVKDFAKKTNQYLAVEIVDPSKRLADKIVSLAEVENTTNENDLFIELIQSSPQAEKGKYGRKYGGAGEVLIAGICNRAIQLGMSSVSLVSMGKDAFYEHIRMSKDWAPHLYILKGKQQLRAFINKTVQKYSDYLYE